MFLWASQIQTCLLIQELAVFESQLSHTYYPATSTTINLYYALSRFFCPARLLQQRGNLPGHLKNDDCGGRGGGSKLYIEKMVGGGGVIAEISNLGLRLQQSHIIRLS